MRSELGDVEMQEPMAQYALPKEVRFLDLLIIIFRRKKFIQRFTTGIAILTIIVVLLIPNKYTATAVILPPEQGSSLSSSLLGQLGGGSGALASLAGAGLGIKSPGDTYVSLFRGRTVEDAVIQRFGLMSRYHEKTMVDARRAFEDRSAVIFGVKDGLIRISVTDKDPRFAADVANGYVEEFRKLTANLAITEASRRRKFFQEQLLEANQNLAAAEEAMKRTQQSTGILQVDSQARSLIETAAALRGQIAAREALLQGMRSYATDDNPQIVVAEQQLEALRTQLGKLGGTDKNPSSTLLLPKGNMPEAGMEYLRGLRDVKYFEAIEVLIAKQFEIAKLDEAREGAIVQIADVAVPPDRKSAPHRTLIVILMTFLGLTGAVLWTLVSNSWNHMRQDPDKGAKIRILAELSVKKK